jgi:hypothetical protein
VLLAVMHKQSLLSLCLDCLYSLTVVSGKKKREDENSSTPLVR